MEISNYAPVIIPTLNRYEHFKQCLESLEQCSGAEHTDVYVALDYPPSEQYISGWEKIDTYLHEKQNSNGFKKLIVYRRKENYFFSGKGNLFTAINDLPQDVDRYILTEDDNEFSPCFLDFMNEALSKFKCAPQIASVSGYNQPSFYINDKDIVFTYDNSGWGLGLWTEKEKQPQIANSQILHSFHYVLKLWKTYPKLLQMLISIERRGLCYGDASRTAQCICEEKYQVRPSLSMVRNLGNDGSGQHSGIDESFLSQKIYEKASFKIQDVKIERTTQLDKSVYNNMLPQSLFAKMDTHLRIAVSLILYYLKA